MLESLGPSPENPDYDKESQSLPQGIRFRFEGLRSEEGWFAAPGNNIRLFMEDRAEPVYEWRIPEPDKWVKTTEIQDEVFDRFLANVEPTTISEDPEVIRDLNTVAAERSQGVELSKRTIRFLPADPENARKDDEKFVLTKDYE